MALQHVREWKDYSNETTVSFEIFRTKIKSFFLNMKDLLREFLDYVAPERLEIVNKEITSMEYISLLERIYKGIFGTQEGLSKWLYQSMGIEQIASLADEFNHEYFSEITTLLMKNNLYYELRSIPRSWVIIAVVALALIF